MVKNLTPRSIAALAVVAICSFLLIVVAVHGANALAAARPGHSAGFAADLSGALVANVGAGIWALLLLPLAWGVVVYFDERTPDLLLRFVGTVVLAFSMSTIAGLAGGGFWAGKVGHAAAGALGGLTDRMGGAGTALAWLVVLALFGVSLVFATDWMFHTLRRAGRAAAAESRPIAVQPAAAELLDDPAESQPRGFVAETPRAAVAAAEMEEIVGATSSEASIPDGWDETEDEGRTVIAAPSGYRGVEFLPSSDDLLAEPGYRAPRTAYVEPVAAAPGHELFHDEQFVATSDVAFSLESPDRETEAETEEVSAAAAAPEVDEIISDAVQTLFEAVTTPSGELSGEPSAAPASGIGLPDDSPFLDEFFAGDAGWPYAAEPPSAAPSDGASAAAEMASTYAPSASPAPESVAAESTEENVVAFEDESVSIDEILVSRLPAEAFDDSLPAAAEPPAESAIETSPAAETAVDTSAAETPPAAPEPVVVAAPAPQLPLFAEPVAAESLASTATASAVATMPDVDLARLHTMELDPLFRNAVNAVLERGRASAVVLQRQLGIGYARGIRILDQMTAAGLTGPDTPTGSREIRVAKDVWSAFSS